MSSDLFFHLETSYLDSYLTKLIFNFRWYFGRISRREAEELLMAHINDRGTFLIRESEQNPGGFALSIKDYEQVTD